MFVISLVSIVIAILAGWRARLVRCEYRLQGVHKTSTKTIAYNGDALFLLVALSFLAMLAAGGEAYSRVIAEQSPGQLSGSSAFGLMLYGLFVFARSAFMMLVAAGAGFGLRVLLAKAGLVRRHRCHRVVALQYGDFMPADAGPTPPMFLLVKTGISSAAARFIDCR